MPEYYNAEPYKSVFDSKFYVPAGSLASATSVQTANQLAEVNARLNAGVYGVDLSLIDTNVANMIPKQHFEEIRRLAKLSNASASMHGPIIDLAGFAQEKYDELQRKHSEIQMNDMVEKAHMLNPEGNTPVNFHVNTQMVGEARRKLDEKEIAELNNPDILRQMHPKEREAIKRGEIIEMVGVVDQDTGKINILKHEIKETPTGKQVYSPYNRIEMLNRTEWDQERLRMFELEKRKEEVRRWLEAEKSDPTFRQLMLGHEQKSLTPEDEQDRIKKIEKINMMESHISEINSNVNTALHDLYHKAEKYSAEKEPFKEFKDHMKGYKKEEIRLVMEHKKAQLAGNKKAKDEIEQQFAMVEEDKRNKEMGFISNLDAPKVWVSSNDYALGKTAETLANTTAEAYKKFGKTSPIITLENYQQDLTLGNAEEMRNAIEKSRELLAKKLMAENKMDKREANETAEKLIGVTWDVGHINLLRKKGYTEEEILRQTKIMAPLIKQVHITDNFGFTDAHLPAGMGNVPIAQQLDILKKAKFGFDRGRLIVEGGEFVQQFKENPHIYTLSAFHSPLYSMKAEPSWYQTWNVQGAYGSGLGNIYPEEHFKLYGTSFSSLPRELGGQASSDRSRFAGTPNE